MANLKRKSKYVFVFILLICVGISLICVGSFERVSAEPSVSVSKEISQGYAFGDEFDVPDCTFTVGGESKKGEHSLRFPNGTYKTDKTTTLNQSGNYVLKYVATIGNKTYTKEYPFAVNSKLATYNNDKTSMEYGLCNHLGANTKGLNLKIANGDSLTFGHVFDMSELTSATKIVEGFVVPEVRGKADFARMVFTFTDVNDPSVQLVYYGNFHDDVNSYGLTFFTAAGNGQVQTGLEYAGKLHVGSTLGCLVPHSFMSVDTGLYYGAYANMAEPVKDAKPDDKQFCISYDYQRNQAWAGGKIISDLDDSNYYNTLWFGFPSGKAKLTISAEVYNGSSANMCITSILGVDLQAENFEDKNPPQIVIDNEYEEMPIAIVGGTYPVPTASASDEENGLLQVGVSVWSEYATANKKSIAIKNGRFKVESVGTYAIVYEAVDYSGNVAREILWVRATLSQNVEALSLMVEDFNTQIEVGTINRLPVVTVSGGSGKNSVTYELSNGTEKFKVENGEFILETAGKWVLTCTAIDYVGNVAVKTVELNGVTSGKPVITSNPKLPVAYISGGTYVLPKLIAYDYTSGSRQEKLCKVEVSYGANNPTTVQSGETFTPTVTQSGDKVKLNYVCDGNSLFQAEVPVIIVFEKEEIGDTGNFRQVISTEKYFYTQNDVLVTTFKNGQTFFGNQGIKFTSNEQAESVKISFINEQIANAFSLNFFTVPNEAKFEGVAITLTDSADESVSVKIMLLKDDGQTKLVLGDTQITLLFDFDGMASSSYSVGYTNGKVVVNSSTFIDVTKTQSGKAFSGFPSGKVYFDVEMLNAEVGASLFLTEISNVKVANNQDNTAPYVSTQKTLETNALKDSVYVIQKVVAGDVLCPNVQSVLTVKNPDGTIATSKDGVLLDKVDASVDYELVMSAYGKYSVLVETTETNWRYSNVSYFEYAVSVVDGEAPIITLKGKFKDTLRVGQTLTIPKFEVTDGHSPKDKIAVMIVITNPKGMPVYLYDNERSIVCEYKGEYKVCIYAYDETGNLAVYEKTVVVK